MDALGVLFFWLPFLGLMLGVLAFGPGILQWWRDGHAAWPYQVSAKWLPSPLRETDLRIVLVVNSLTTKSSNFEPIVHQDGEPESNLRIQRLDGDPPRVDVVRMTVGPLDRSRYLITLDHPGPVGRGLVILLQEDGHPGSRWVPVGDHYSPPTGPRGWVLRYRVWKVRSSRPTEDLGGWT
jgi:hypothetical protein